MIAQKLQILIDADDKASKKIEGLKGKIQGMSASLKKVGIAATAVGAAITTAMVFAVKESAKAEGSINKFNTVFGEHSEDMMNFVKNIRKEMPTATHEIVRMAADLQDLLVPMGVARDKATDLSKGFIDVSNKIAAFSDVEPTEVLEAIKSGLAGSTEPLRRFGVNALESALEAKALQMGLIDADKGFKDLNPEVKTAIRAQALYAQIVSNSSDAIEGFEENQDSFLRRWQDLQATLKEFKVLVGNTIMPILDKLLKEHILPLVEKIKDWTEKNPELTATIVKFVAIIGALMVVLGPLLIMLPGIVTAFTILTGPIGIVSIAITALIYLIIKIKKQFKELKEMIMSFGGIGNVFKAIGSKIGGLLGFQEGGIVPGGIGQPQLAVVHGGEEIIPYGKNGNNQNNYNFDFRGANIVDKENFIREITKSLNRGAKLSSMGI
jgi:hypothetical protein